MSAVSQLLANKYVRYVLIVLLAAAAAVSIAAGVKNAVTYSQDFQWDAAKALVIGADPYELSEHPEQTARYPELEAFYKMFTDMDLKQKMEANQFPSLLVLLAPMTVFSPQTAKIVWCVLNLLFTAGIIYLMRRTFFEKADAFVYAVIALLMLAGTPYRNQIGVGQHTLFSFFFFMLAVYVEQKKPFKKETLNSTALTLCLFVSYFKYTLTAPLALYFLYRRKYKELAFSAALHVILTKACALWLGKSFIYMIKAPLSVASFLASEGGIDLGVLLPSGASMVAAGVVFLLLALITVILPKDNDNVVLALLMLWSLIMTYHRTYDFFVLSAVAVLFTKETVFGSGTKAQSALLCFYALTVCAVYFVLRIFSENVASRAAVAALYYAFTAVVTVIAIRMIRTGKTDNG